MAHWITKVLLLIKVIWEVTVFGLKICWGRGGGAVPLLVNAFSRCPLLLHLNKMPWSTSYFLPGSNLGADSSVHPKLHSDQHARQCAGQGKNGNSLVPVMPMGLLLHRMSWIPVIIIHPLILWHSLYYLCGKRATKSHPSACHGLLAWGV